MSSQMTLAQVRHWIGAYTLALSLFVGTYLILVPLPILPLDPETVSSGFQILLPFLFSQIVVAWRFFATPVTAASGAETTMPAFVVKMPLVGASAVLALLFLLLAVGGLRGAPWTPSPAQFKATITFAVSVLNATTVFVVSRVFAGSTPAHGSDVPT